jgi:hypothetical protein
MLRLCLPLVLAVTAFVPWSAAAEEPVPVRIVYVPHAGCPSSDLVSSKLFARAPRLRRAKDGEPARFVRVELRKEDEGTRGTLTVDDDSASAREVRGHDCGEVVDALALIAAVAVVPEVPEPDPIVAPPVAQPASVDTKAPEAAAPSTSRGLQPRFGAGAEILRLSGTVVAPKIGLALADRGDGPLAWSFGVSFATASSAVENVAGAGALRWYLLSIDGCALRLRIAGRTAFEGCARIMPGLLDVDASPGGRVSRPWFGIGPVGRLHVADLAPLTLGIELSAIVPVVRPSFAFEGDELYGTPAVVPTAGFFVGVAIP